jgi:hypothetical protein
MGFCAGYCGVFSLLLACIVNLHFAIFDMLPRMESHGYKIYVDKIPKVKRF